MVFVFVLFCFLIDVGKSRIRGLSAAIVCLAVRVCEIVRAANPSLDLSVLQSDFKCKNSIFKHNAYAMISEQNAHPQHHTCDM